MFAKNTTGLLAITVLMCAGSYSNAAQASVEADMGRPDSLSLITPAANHSELPELLVAVESPHIHYDKGGHYHHDHESTASVTPAVEESTFIV